MKPAGWLFVAFLALYLLTGGGHFYASDDVQKLAVLDALADHHTVAIADGWIRGADGRRYAWFPFGASLVMLPGWALGRLATSLVPGLPATFVMRFCVAMQNAALSAALVALLYGLARLLGARVRGAALAAVALGLGSMVWPYAKTAWSEPATALCLYGGLGALWLALSRPRWLWVAGLALAAAVSIRQELAIPAVGACAWWLARHRGRSLLPLVLPLGVMAALLLAYDQLRYGNPWGFPSYQLPQKKLVMAEGRLGWSLRNIYQYTLSPNQGVVWYSPVVLAGLAGLRRLEGRFAGLLLATLGPLALFYVVGWGVSSWAWGLRYAYVFLPALVLPVAWAPVGLTVTTLVLGVAVQLLAVLHNPLELYERELARVHGLTIRQLVQQEEHAPLWLALQATPATLARGRQALAGTLDAHGSDRQRRQGLPDLWWILALVEPVPRGLVLGLAAALAALTAAAWAGLVRAVRARPPAV